MGKHNQARRAAKAKQRAKARAQQRHRDAPGSRRGPDSWRDAEHPASAHEPIFSDAEAAEIAWCQVAEVGVGRRMHATAQGAASLDRLPRKVVLTVAERLLREHLALLWEHGWQPRELHRQARISGRGRAVRLVETAVAYDVARRLDGAPGLDPRWREQAEPLIAPLPTGLVSGWLERWAREESVAVGGAEPYSVIADAMRVLFNLPGLDVLIPPPGHQVPAAQPRRQTSDPMLDRVRALLAKAESTEFEAEAIALTAKAQELITRHAIDTAALAGSTAEETGGPTMVRVPIDPPYADAKSLLLQTVAAASRCRAVFTERVSMSTVIGLSDDLTAVEILFTSLLVQAQHALAEAGRSAPPGSQPRSQSFRSAFLLAYTQRIGERLEEINTHVFAAAEAESDAFLPVLRSQEDAIEDFMAERFGELTSSAVRGGYSPRGWASGRQAADQAKLNAGDLDRPPAGRLAPPADDRLF